MLNTIDFQKYDICDCHHHIYNPIEFPYPDKSTTQPAATAEDYLYLKEKLGIKRNVIVQPSCYGTDNACTLDALQNLGQNNTRAIVVIDDDTPIADIRYMNSIGVRGVRFNIAPGHESHVESIKAQARLIADFGWSMHFWMSADYTYEIRNVLQELPCQIVFDHRGHLPAEEGTAHPAFDFICEMMVKEKAWVKISGPYLDSNSPDYTDTYEIGKKYVTISPNRVVWGTDWPHPVCYINNEPMPDDFKLLNDIRQEINSINDLHKILVENPKKLFGF